MLDVNTGFDPLLKRPFSLHRWLGRDFQLLYRTAGKGTYLLSKKRKGDTLEVLGPLGNGFPVRKKAKNIMLVAGGIGIAPIIGLAEALVPSKSVIKKGGMHKNLPVLFYGARTKNEILCTDDLRSLDMEPIISTDDGTLGKKGNIVNVIKRYLTAHPSRVRDSVFFACGPTPMLKALSTFAVRHKIRGYAALEEHMACGIGTCLGCVVQTSRGHKRVCREGPVFPIEEIIW